MEIELMYKLINTKEYTIYLTVGKQTKTIPPKGYLYIELSAVELSQLKAQYANVLKFTK